MWSFHVSWTEQHWSHFWRVDPSRKIKTTVNSPAMWLRLPNTQYMIWLKKNLYPGYSSAMTFLTKIIPWVLFGGGYGLAAHHHQGNNKFYLSWRVTIMRSGFLMYSYEYCVNWPWRFHNGKLECLLCLVYSVMRHIRYHLNLMKRNSFHSQRSSVTSLFFKYVPKQDCWRLHGHCLQNLNKTLQRHLFFFLFCQVNSDILACMPFIFGSTWECATKYLVVPEQRSGSL